MPCPHFVESLQQKISESIMQSSFLAGNFDDGSCRSDSSSIFYGE